LTETLSQTKITNLEKIQISSSLYALSFKTIQFMPNVLFGSYALPITKSSFRRGTPGAGQDSIQLSGVIGVVSSDLVNANDINIKIRSVGGNHLFFSESINFNPNNMQRGIYTYSHTFVNGEPGGITSFQLDMNRHTFKLQISKVNLTGLTWPISVEIEIGDYLGIGQR
jgi:hypothetical protein